MSSDSDRRNATSTMVDSMRNTLDRFMNMRPSECFSRFENNTQRNSRVNFEGVRRIRKKLNNMKMDIKRAFSLRKLRFRTDNITNFNQNDIDTSIKNILKDPETILGGKQIVENQFDLCKLPKHSNQKIADSDSIAIPIAKDSEVVTKENCAPNQTYSISEGDAHVSLISKKLSDISIKLPDNQKNFEPDRKFFNYTVTYGSHQVVSDTDCISHCGTCSCKLQSRVNAHGDFISKQIAKDVSNTCNLNSYTTLQEREIQITRENVGNNFKIKTNKHGKSSRFNPMSRRLKVAVLKKRNSSSQIENLFGSKLV